MIGFLIAFFSILLLVTVVIGVPFAFIYAGVVSVKDEYALASSRKDKIHALCLPLVFASPFLYYNFIHDSLWQAVLSVLIIPVLVEEIFGTKTN